MQRVIAFFRKEHRYFQALGKDAQLLLFSYILANIADPILFIFLNAFLWEKSNSLPLLSWYNTALFIGLPIGFYLNGQLLKRISPTKLYLTGSVLQGTVASTLFFFSFIAYTPILIFGITFGIAMGLHWANRNLFSLRLTSVDNRIYFSSLESTLTTPISIVVPLVIGWFLYFGRVVHWYTLDQAYQLLALFAIVILSLAGMTVKNIQLQKPDSNHIIVRKASKHWHLFRLFTVFSGLQSGISLFLPTIMILTFLGKENILGTVQAGATILSAIAIYIVGRTADASHRIRIFFVSFLLLMIGGTLFGYLYSGIGVLIYVAFVSLEQPFGWSGGTSISQDTTDTEEAQSSYPHFAYIFDAEVFLNIGRIAGIGIFYLLISKVSDTFALRYTPFIIGASQILLVFMAQVLDKKNLAEN